VPLKPRQHGALQIVTICLVGAVQAVKQKLHIKPRLQLPDALLPKLTGRDPEADKAKLLMGDTLSVSSLMCRGFICLTLVCLSVPSAFSALTLLVGCQEEHLAWKKIE